MPVSLPLPGIVPTLATRLLATPAGSGFTTDQATVAVLTGLAVLQAETGQTLTYVADDTVRLQGLRRSDLELPERPVANVTAVSGLAPSWLDVESYVGPLIPYLENVGYYFDGLHTLRRIGLYTAAVWFGPIQVTYSHGYTDDAFPELLCAVIVSVAGRIGANVDPNVKSEGLGGYSVSYGDVSGVSLTTDERRLLSLAGFRQTCTS